MKTRLPRKALSLFLSLVMMLSLLPTMAWATEGGATPVAKIGEQEYDTLADAVAAAESGNTVEIIKAGEYSVPTPLTSITVKGAVGGVIFNAVGTGNIAAAVNVTFQNITFNMGNGSYHGFQHNGGIRFEECVFNGLFNSYGTEYYYNCTFNQHTKEYCMWVYGGDTITYDTCTFNTCGKVLNVYNENNGHHNLVVKDCTFKNENNSVCKPAVLIKSKCGAAELEYDVAISGSNTLVGNWPSELSVYNDGNMKTNGLWDVEGDGSKIAVTVDNSKVFPEAPAVNVDSTDTLQQALDNAKDGDTIVLAAGSYDTVYLRQNLAKSTAKPDLDRDASYPAYYREIKNVTIKAADNATVTMNGNIVAESGLFWYSSAPASNQAAMDKENGGFVSYLLLENLTINGLTFYQSGIVLRDNAAVDTRSNICVDGLTIQNCTGTGTAANNDLHFFSAGAGTNDQNFPNTEKKAFNNITIRNNTLDSYYQPICTNNATAVLNGLTVIGNRFTDCMDNQLQLANKVNTGAFVISGNTFTNMTGRVLRLTNAQETATFDLTNNIIVTPKKYDTGGDGTIAKITGVNGFTVTDMNSQWTAGAFNEEKTTWQAMGDTSLLAQPVAKINDTKYATLQAAVAAVNDSQTIEILCDIPDAVGMTINNGKTFTIDFKNHTYTVGKPGAGSTGTKTQGFQIIKGSNVTFKDGTIRVDPANKDVTWEKDATEKGIAWLINNYGNMTLTNMTINGENLAHNFVTIGGQEAAGTPRYVINNNTNSMTMTGGSITAAAGDVAVSANWYDSPSYPDHPAVTLTNATIAGKVEAIGGKINLKNGTTVHGMVRVGENGKDGDKKTPGTPGAVVTIENGATVNAVVAVFGGSTLNVEGTVNGYIATNGNAYNKGSVVNIKDGANIVATGDGIDVAVYIPNGTLNLSGGTITGETAVYFKSTNLNITGGTLIATGERKAYKYDGNGCNATGDALVIDSCNYPNGIDHVSISGGSFKSTNANAVTAFTKDNTCTPVTKFITGGYFSTAPDAAYVVVGKDVVSNPNAVTKTYYPYTIGTKQADVVIKDGDAVTKVTTEVTTTTDYSVDTTEVTLDDAQKTAIETRTEVKGVELKKDASVGTGDNKVTGVQAVINAAKAQATETAASGSDAEKTAAAAFNAAVETANNTDTVVTVKVDVEVKPTEFNTTNEIKFELKPVATVTIQNGTAAAATQTVDVTNDMIDQEQDIEVSIYTGAKPAQILHKEGDKVIDSFTGNQIVFDEATGVSKVIIHHFSDLVAVMQNSAVVTYVAKNVQTDTQYTTLTQALTEAQSGETVVLLKDVSNVQFVIISDGVTLNLNGHNITRADLIYNNGAIKDTVGNGYIQASAYTFCNSESEYFAVYDETVNGYKFINTVKILSKFAEDNTNKIKFHLQKPDNANDVEALKELLKSAAKSEKLKVNIIVTTYQDTGSLPQVFSFYQEYVEELAGAIDARDLYAIFEDVPSGATIHAQLASMIGNNNIISVVNGTKLSK